MDIIFHQHINGQTLPGKIECTRMLDEHKEFKGRLWIHFKDFVRNHKTKLAQENRIQSSKIVSEKGLKANFTFHTHLLSKVTDFRSQNVSKTPAEERYFK